MIAFIDTNILIYAVSSAPEDAVKRTQAQALLKQTDVCLSTQVVQEFIHTCLRKQRLGQSPETIAHAAKQLLSLPCHQSSSHSILYALQIQQRYAISYWDAAILAAAHDLGCHTLYSEDLNHGQDYDGVCVVNPFH